MDFFTIFAIAIVIYLVYLYYHKAFQYWEKKGIPTIKPSIPFGNVENPLFSKIGMAEKMAKFHKEFRAKGAKLGGLYAGGRPILLVVDPEWIKNVVSKDFQYFNSHGMTFDEKAEPLEAHLFNIDGKRWKEMRVKMTPTFTSGKMKMMFQTLLDIGKQLEDFVHECHQKNQSLDIKEILACYTTDVIGSCAFGLDCNSFKNPDAEFRYYGRKLFEPTLRFRIRNILTMVSPYITKLLKLHFTDKESSKFFMTAVRNLVDYRTSNKVTRDDFMQILIDMKDKFKNEGKAELTIEEMAAQAFVFFLAGFETSSTTMTFCLYELAYHQDVQDKLREEIKKTIAKNGGKLTYESLGEMKYLDQTVSETLRKYPPVDPLPRKCSETYILPNGHKIEKGTNVFISTLGVQRDEEYFPNPDKFDPDRFNDENKHNIVPYSYIPFGEGPRICIGMRFGAMQAKVGLCLLLKNYKILPHESLKYPIEFDSRTVVLSAKGNILLNTQKV